MTIFMWIVLYLVIGVLLTLWLYDPSIDAEFDTWTNVFGYAFAIIMWPFATLIPLIKSVCIGLMYFNPKKRARVKEIIDEWNKDEP